MGTGEGRAGSGQLVVVANRLPVRAEGEGEHRQWVTSPGGLVSAIAPALVDRPDATWIGWTGWPDDAPPPFDHEGTRLVPVPLSKSEVIEYYEGFSNSTLWPLYHDAIVVPEFHREWWEAYQQVNQRFADATAAAASPGATVWVHDYQLQLVPAMLRQARPDLRIGFFLHIPFPARELFLRMPWRVELVEGLLGADLIGFQTSGGALNFRQLVTRLRAGTLTGRVLHADGRRVRAECFPVGIAAERFVAAASDPAVQAHTEVLREQLGFPEKVLLGVDRLDYTKGIDLRLRGFRELLHEGRVPEGTVLVQIAEPSRSNVNGYTEVRRDVEHLVGEINGDFATLGRPVVHYLHQSHDFAELCALYRLADVMVVTPFRDGMNLVAKEYVASRVDETGVLILSEFAGAANELTQAVLVNPFDVDGAKDAMAGAVLMSPGEQRRRMRALRRVVLRATAAHWAASFLDALERTDHHEYPEEPR